MGTPSVKKSGGLSLGLSATTYDNMAAGHIEVGVAQVPLVAATIPCFEVLVQADPDNGFDIYVGDMTYGCHIHMEPGDVIVIPINDVEKVYARSQAGAQTVNWLAMLSR